MTKFGDMEITLSCKPLGKITSFKVPVDKKFVKMFKLENVYKIAKIFNRFLKGSLHESNSKNTHNV